MKKKDLDGLRHKTGEELAVDAGKLRLEIVKAKMDLAMHRSKNTNAVKNLRKTLAQTLTIEREVELCKVLRGK